MELEGVISESAEKPTKVIRVDRQRTVFPAHHAHPQRVDLSVFDVRFLLLHYNERGLLYEIPAHSFPSAIDRLDKSLSQILAHFYPLAGRLSFDGVDAHIDCNDAGATFIEATAENLTVEDVMAAAVPTVVYELFPLKDALNIEGHRLPLLAVQVTQLRDGIFVACSINHAVADGLSLWHFFNSWAEICGGGADSKISLHPIHNRWASPAAWRNLHPDAVFERFSPPVLKARMFHFSADVIKRLKDRANRESTQSPISSLQALCAHVWQAITRARQLGPEELTMFQFAIDCRARLVPPLPASLFGNVIQKTTVTTTVSEMASKDVVFLARLLHGLIRSYGDRTIRETIDSWEKNPLPLNWGTVQNKKNVVVMGSSPRFRVYENDFGWGKPVAVRSGCGNKADGKVQTFAAKDGGGSMDLEICLIPKTMEALESDEHFLNPLIV